MIAKLPKIKSFLHPSTDLSKRSSESEVPQSVNMQPGSSHIEPNTEAFRDETDRPPSS